MDTITAVSNCLRSHRRLRAFTLIEILIVVVILGILGAIVIAGVSNASGTAKHATLRESLLQLRNQIQFYSTQHHDALPDAADLAAQLMGTSDEFGNIGTGGQYRYGPYVSSMPANPFNGKSNVTGVAGGGPITADGTSSGWLYQINGSAFVIKANTTGSDHENHPYVDF